MGEYSWSCPKLTIKTEIWLLITYIISG